MKAPGTTTHYEQRVFSAQQERIVRFADVIDQVVGCDIARILDIGCGTGSQVMELARRYPAAALMGVDISRPNIEAAERASEDISSNDRLDFVTNDYMDLRVEPFDLIVSYSTVQLIPATTDRLMQKVASDLAPGGIFITAMPYECMYNKLLIGLRRLFRACRGATSDRLVYLVGRALTPGTVSDKQLSERIMYMYVIPERMDGRSFRQSAQRSGLSFVAERPELHASLAQLKHRIVVFRKN